MNKKKRNTKKYISSFIILFLLLLSVFWLGYHYYYIPIKQADIITTLIGEGTHQSMQNARNKLIGLETVGSKRERLEDHEPLPARPARKVKRALLNILSTTEDMEILRRALSLTMSATSQPERSGIVIEDSKDWEIIELSINRYNSSNHHPRSNYFISNDEAGNKVIGRGSYSH